MNPLTTDEVRNLVALNVMTGELDPEQVARFEAWVRATVAGGLRDAADEFADMHRRGELDPWYWTEAADLLNERADEIERGDR